MGWGVVIAPYFKFPFIIWKQTVTCFFFVDSCHFIQWLSVGIKSFIQYHSNSFARFSCR